MLKALETNPVFFFILGGILLAALIIVLLEKQLRSQATVKEEKLNPLYKELENAEHMNCRLTFSKPDSYKEFGPVLECNIHNVGKEWVHVTFPINTDDDTHKIINMEEISSVELLDDCQVS